MALTDSLLSAIVRADGDALVMHVGERPYVVVGTQTINISTHGLNLEVMTGMLSQLLTAEAHVQLEEFGAVEHKLPQIGDDRFSVVAARGGDDIWIEIRRRRPKPAAVAPEVVNVEAPAAVAPVAAEAAPTESAPVEAGASQTPVQSAPEPISEPSPTPQETPAVEAVAAAAPPIPEAVSDVTDESTQAAEIDAAPAPAVAAAPELELTAAQSAPMVEAPIAQTPIPEAPIEETHIEPSIETPTVAAAIAEPLVTDMTAEIAPVEASTLEAPAENAPIEASITEAPAVEPQVGYTPPPVVAEVVEVVAAPILESPAPEPQIVAAAPPPIAEVAPAAEAPSPESPAPSPQVGEPIPAPIAEVAPVIETPVEQAPIEELPAAVEAAAELPAEEATASPEPEAPATIAASVETPRVETPAVDTPEIKAAEPEPPASEPPVEPEVAIPLTRTVRIEVPPRPAAARTTPAIDRLLRVASARSATALYLLSDSPPSVRIEGDLRQIDGEGPLTRAEVEAAILEIAPESAHESIGRGEATEWIAEFADVGRMRCTTFVDHRGPGVVLRMVATRAATAEQLGLSREVQALATEPQGLVLVAGPRGGGKSTLLSALVDHVNRQRADYIITLERQIRLWHDHRQGLISQREIRGGPDDLLNATRSALRENPGVLVVDDLVSPQMVPLLLTAAADGLLVFVSITAASTADAVARFVELAPPETRKAVLNAMAECFRGAVAQVLLKKAGGGQVAAREVLLATGPVMRALGDGQLAQLPATIDGGRKYGMVSFTDTLAEFVRTGAVDVREAFRKAPERERLLEALKRDGIDTSVVERLA